MLVIGSIKDLIFNVKNDLLEVTKRIFEGFKYDSRHIINKKEFIKEFFDKKGFVIPNKFLKKLNNKSIYNENGIIFYPKDGKFKNFLFLLNEGM